MVSGCGSVLNGTRIRPSCAGREFASAQPGAGVAQAAAGFVEHGEGVAGGGDFLEHAEPALLHQRAAALAVADEFDDVDAAALEFRELERRGRRGAPASPGTERGARRSSQVPASLCDGLVQG